MIICWSYILVKSLPTLQDFPLLHYFTKIFPFYIDNMNLFSDLPNDYDIFFQGEDKIFYPTKHPGIEIILAYFKVV